MSFSNPLQHVDLTSGSGMMRVLQRSEKDRGIQKILEQDLANKKAASAPKKSMSQKSEEFARSQQGKADFVVSAQRAQQGFDDNGNLVADPNAAIADTPNPFIAYKENATKMQSDFAANQASVGTAPLAQAKMIDTNRSKMEQMVGGSMLSSNGHPDGPGFAYFNHLYNRVGTDEALKQAKKEEMTGGSNIYTESQEALKSALLAMGINTSMNPAGLPIGFKDAQALWFGKEEVSDDELTQWRNKLEMGDSRIDPKRVRKFSNYDGSLTWELLNEDKTVSSRFTIGEYAGTKIFSQGGYSKFTELLAKVKQQVGYDDSTGFDAIRGSY